MNSARTLYPLLLAPALLAQEEVKIARPPQVSPDVKTQAPALVKEPTPGHVWQGEAVAPAPRKAAQDTGKEQGTRRLLSQVLGNRDLVVFDEPQAGQTLWASGRDFKVGIDADTWTFVGRPEAGASRDWPVHFSLRNVQVGGKDLPLTTGTVERSDRRIAMHRGPVRELLDVRGDGVEQSFAFDTLPERAAITVTIDVHTDLDGRDLGDGVLFDGPSGDVGYAEAVAIDAKGARVHAETTFADGRITITVPAEFVATAQLPLLIDPLVSSRAVHTTTWDIEEMDIAWDESFEVWTVVWQRNFSATDTDVFAQRLNASMDLLVGPVTTIDNSTTAWERPRIANNNRGNNFLVVAQVSADISSPYWIGARLLHANGTLGSQFVVEQAGLPGHAQGDKIRPDVCGDPYLIGDTYFTIAWERVFSANDHDLHFKQVANDGTLRAASPSILDNSTVMHSHLAMSKSAGPGPAADQRIMIAFQERFSATDEDVWGAMLTWDGVVIQRNGSNKFPVDTGGANNVEPAVSTPTSGPSGRFALFAYGNTSVNNGDIEVTLTDIQGQLLATAMMPTLQQFAQFQTDRPQVRPVVDSDGCRFTVGYDQLFTAGTDDWDTRVSLVSWVAPTLRCDEPVVTVGNSSEPETGLALASRYSGSGRASNVYGLVDELVDPTNQHVVQGFVYDAVGTGGIAMRPAGCGNLLTVVAGRPALGESFTLSLQTNAFGGFLTGAAFPATVVGLCPQCTIAVGPGPTLSGTQHTIQVPCIPSLVGGGITVQGFAFDGFDCLGAIRAGNAYDITVQ